MHRFDFDFFGGLFGLLFRISWAFDQAGTIGPIGSQAGTIGPIGGQAGTIGPIG